MLVVFWSPTVGHGRTTSTMLATACSLCLDYQVKILVSDARGTGDITRAFSSLRGSSVDSMSGEGIRAVSRLMESGKLDARGVSSSATYIIDGDRLDILKTEGSSLPMLNRTLPIALEMSKEVYSLTFVDVGGGMEDSSADIYLSRADLVVVCVPQDNSKLSSLKKGIEKKLDGKSFIVAVGSYESDSSITPTKIGSVLGVKRTRVGVIPRNVAFMDSVGKENIISVFIRIRAYKKSLLKMSPNELFVKRTRDFGELLLKTLDMKVEKRESA